MPVWQHRNGKLDLNNRTAVMGILNITPDSFSDGGRYLDPDRAAARAMELEAEGADILDIGPQSTRPGHIPVSPDEELERLDKARGNLGGETKRRHVTQKDLYILRQRLDGRSYDSLCAELGWSRAQVRRNMQGTRMRLIRDLRVELDVPQLFKPYKPSWSLPDPDNYVEAHGKMTSTLGVHIAAYRKEHGETVAQFASRSGVSVSSIRRIESGISDPSADLVWKISRHMGMTMDDLFKKMP